VKEKSKLQEEQSFFPVPVTLRGERIMACMFKLTTLFCSLFLSLCSLAQEKEKTPEFSNTDEIHLVITQSGLRTVQAIRHDGRGVAHF
jgi:hypothetical protein